MASWEQVEKALTELKRKDRGAYSDLADEWRDSLPHTGGADVLLGSRKFKGWIEDNPDEADDMLADIKKVRRAGESTMDKQRVAAELVKLAKDLTGAGLYDLEQIRDRLKQRYGSKGVRVKGNDLALSINISRTTSQGVNIHVSYNMYATRDGDAIGVEGTELVEKDGDVIDFQKVRKRLKSDTPDSYIPKLNQRRLKTFEDNYIESWLDTDWD